MESIFDTHLHLVDRSRISYPWIRDAGTLDRDWSHAEYAAEASACGITRALHMEVDAAEDMIGAEVDFIESLPPRKDVPIVGIISACRPEHDGFAAEIERAQARPSVVGFRRVLHVVPDALSQTARFRQNIRRLGPAGLPFDICMLARQLPLAMELVDAAPETRFVLDHCGVPDIAGGQFDSWARDISALAKRPNLSAKVSGIPSYAAKDWTAEDMRRWIEHVVAAFGFDRVVWGSDWFVCTQGGGLTKWVETCRTVLAGVSPAERVALFSGNAEKIWRVGGG
ncbi:amidohydrolase family protein [Paracoccus pacificus]|uniref:Amidohydrolase family protein n=1 Tax=Paracoccus pacificus TaxID=1463598 RepID=A0ABW4R310_9RHOB